MLSMRLEEQADEDAARGLVGFSVHGEATITAALVSRA